jgi:carbon dioxide concentrating mechanism protein CcmM
MKMKILFQSSFIMLVLALLITISITNNSFSQQENIQEQQKIQASQPGTQNLTEKYEWPNIHENVNTDFNSNVSYPEIANTAFIHPFAVIIGACQIGEFVMVSPTAVCRGDEGTPIHISAHSNMQDDVVIHGLETTKDGKNLDNKRYTNDGKLLLGNDTRFKDGYSVFVGERTSLAHGTLVHGPAYIGNDTFVGMESLVFNAKVGNNVAIGVSSTITGGVELPDNKFVPPGSIITTQEQVDKLPNRIGSPYENINEEVIHVNEELGEEYEELDIEKIIGEREATMERNMLETSMSSQ